MVNVSDVKTVGEGFSNGAELVRVVYDFGVDAGAIGDLSLLISDVGGCVAKLKYMKVITAFTSAGSATMSVGKGASGTEFLSAVAVAALTLDSMHLPSAPAAVELTSAEFVNLDIAVAAMTAGKCEFVFEIMKRS